MNVTRTGTVKIGRWTYPVREVADGTERNATTKGTGAWLPIEEPKFDDVVWDAPATVEAVKLTPAAQALVAAIANGAFDFFDDGYATANSGIWFEHMCQQTPNPAGARKAARELEKKGLVGITEPQPTVDNETDRWLYLTPAGAAAAAAVQGDGYSFAPLGKAPAAHTKGGGNQTKKPGKSTWKIGDPCPQGHKLTEANLYVMPSGRKQCKDCRAEMPSRKSQAK